MTYRVLGITFEHAIHRHSVDDPREIASATSYPDWMTARAPEIGWSYHDFYTVLDWSDDDHNFQHEGSTELWYELTDGRI